MAQATPSTTPARLRAALERWRESLVVLACVCGAAMPEVAQAVESEASEAAVQAAYLFNFARFTEWPAAAFASKTAPLNYCLLGRREALASAMASLNERPVQGHPLRFSQPERAEDAKACHLVFLADPDARHRAQALQALSGLPTLTVSDVDGFTQDGGMIRLLRVGSRLRFEINRAPTQKAGLRLSADLLNLATAVIDAEAGGER